MHESLIILDFYPHLLVERTYWNARLLHSRSVVAVLFPIMNGCRYCAPLLVG